MAIRNGLKELSVDVVGECLDAARRIGARRAGSCEACQ